MKLGKLEFDAKKILPVASFVLGIAGMLVSNQVQANERSNMKSEIKNELVKELLENK